VILSSITTHALASASASNRTQLVFNSATRVVTLQNQTGTRRFTVLLSGLVRVRARNQSGIVSECILPPDAEVAQSESGLRIRTPVLKAGTEVLPIKAALAFVWEGDCYSLSGTVLSDSAEWVIEEAVMFENALLAFSATNPVVYWPHDLGLRFTDPKEFGSRSFEYPGSRGSMAWYAVGDETGGIYVGSHDPERRAKKFSLQYRGSSPGFVFSLTVPVHDRSVELPKVVIRDYAGTWHEAARTYRSWFDSVFKRAVAPDWLRNNEGFILAIFKQQNGDVMWKYPELDRLCDLGEKLGFRLLGVWGWGVGGHDRLYPYWSPDNLLGGRTELKQAIQRAQKRGFKVIVYSNGTLIDAATDYYAVNGLDTVLQDSTGRPVLDFYVKYNNATPVIFTRACPGSSVWRNTLLTTALAAKDLGIDAFYIDQVGVRGPDLCYSSRHDHVHPQDSHTKWRVAMMKQIRDALRKDAPDFPLITEGTTDSLLEDVDAYHSMWNGGPLAADGRTRTRPKNHFPELYRFTFPETVIIYLNSQPVLPRWDANYAVAYGMRHEIMSRYPADAELLRTGKAPVADDYKVVNYPPDVRLISETSLEESVTYVRSLTTWRTAHAELLLQGRFVDSEGVVMDGEGIVAKAFVNGQRMGIVVWNPGTQPAMGFKVTVPGWRLTGASAPSQATVDPLSPLEANSVRLVAFERE
jgi:hypothetical protein